MQFFSSTECMCVCVKKRKLDTKNVFLHFLRISDSENIYFTLLNETSHLINQKINQSYFKSKKYKYHIFFLNKAYNYKNINMFNDV